MTYPLCFTYIFGGNVYHSLHINITIISPNYLIALAQNMEHAVQDIKVSENLVQVIASARVPKTGFYAVFLSRTRFLCVINN